MTDDYCRFCNREGGQSHTENCPMREDEGEYVDTPPVTDALTAAKAFEAEYLPSGLRETPEWQAVLRALDPSLAGSGDVERGTMRCPICGLDQPHSHSDEEVMHRRDQLVTRLGRLKDGLSRGFYTAARLVYGTDFSTKAEAALGKDLELTIAALHPVSNAP